MYPTLKTDPRLGAWIHQAVTELEVFGRENAEEFRSASRENRFPRELYAALGEMGYLGPMTPKEYGGLGGGIAEYVVIGEEVGRHHLVSGQIAAQGQRWLMDWGTDQQKDQWLGAISRGRAVFSESISEKGVGSSFKAMRSTATRDGDDWILNGSKTHVNLGADSDVTLFYAMAEEGLTSFLVDMTLPGITTAVTEPVGLRMIRTSDIDFVDVRVPSSALLGPAGAGMKTFLSTFNVSRLGNASELIGLGRRAMALGLDYATKRSVGDGVVTDFQGIQWMVADAWTALQAASLARDDAAMAYERGEDIALHTTTAKHLAISAADAASSCSFSLVGGHGLYVDEPYTSILNDIKVLKVGGGSAEILRNFIARQVVRDPMHEGIA